MVEVALVGVVPVTYAAVKFRVVEVITAPSPHTLKLVTPFAGAVSTLSLIHFSYELVPTVIGLAVRLARELVAVSALIRSTPDTAADSVPADAPVYTLTLRLAAIYRSLN